jgi:UDP-N-acetylglucosamine/UDP-N-acetylgalactosamine diphosphorylase
MPQSVKEIKTKLEKYEQEHLFAFWEQLEHAEKKSLIAQIEMIDFALIEQFKNLVTKEHLAYDPEELAPAPFFPLDRTPEQQDKAKKARDKGCALLKEGKIGAIMVAGGQGSRLGFDAPKGAFPVGPVSERTLFQYHFENIVALEKKMRQPIPLYIMTSKMNHQDTRKFLQKHDYFSKDKQTIHFFQQGMLPAFDENGKIILADKGSIALSPDGHGGLLNALKHNQLFKQMEKQGLEYLYYFQVDNVLVNICDPEFVGMHILDNCDMSAKTCAKREPFEKLGNIGIMHGKYVTIEYTELTDKDKTDQKKDGRLKYEQGSIAIHTFDIEFIRSIAESKDGLPLHLAHKKIPCVDEGGKPITPKSPNGYKLEQFIFDAFPFADTVLVMETDREKEFSPIKNAQGNDSPKKARQDLSNYFAAWFEELGIHVPRDDSGNSKFSIEISPLYAQDAAELGEKLPSGFEINDNLLLE